MHENDGPKSSIDIYENQNQESMDFKETEEFHELDHHLEDQSSDNVKRNWQSVVQEELKDVIQFDDDNDFDLVDLDQDFGIDKINNVKPIMDLEGEKYQSSEIPS